MEHGIEVAHVLRFVAEATRQRGVARRGRAVGAGGPAKRLAARMTASIGLLSSARFGVDGRVEIQAATVFAGVVGAPRICAIKVSGGVASCAPRSRKASWRGAPAVLSFAFVASNFSLHSLARLGVEGGDEAEAATLAARLIRAAGICTIEVAGAMASCAPGSVLQLGLFRAWRRLVVGFFALTLTRCRGGC